MDRALKNRYLQESRATMYALATPSIIEPGKLHMSETFIDHYTAEWVKRNGGEKEFAACHGFSLTFYAYCRAIDKQHFLRLMESVHFKLPSWQKMRILFPETRPLKAIV